MSVGNSINAGLSAANHVLTSTSYGALKGADVFTKEQACPVLQSVKWQEEP